MIFWFCAFYGMTVVSLWMIVCGEYRHRRRLHIPADAVSGSVVACREQRLNGALSKWTIQLAESDLSNPAPDVPTQSVPTQSVPIQSVTTQSVTTQSEPVTEEPEPQTGSVEYSFDTSHEHSEFKPMETNTADIRSGRPEEHPTMPLAPGTGDYYEVMQISRHADMETIHRVYRIMAARFHPDNPKTGNLERFLALRQANQVLSDPTQRAEYDAARRTVEAAPLVIFELKDFVYGIEGEINRRLGVLSLLYHRRRIHHDNDANMGFSVLELERRMSFPREYLDFTLWYLKAKGYIFVMDENSDFGLTALGVDYVESHSSTNSLVRQMLTLASGAAGADSEPAAMPTAAKPMSMKPVRHGREIGRRRDLSSRYSSARRGGRLKSRMGNER